MVDVQNAGFQCVKYPKTKFFLPFKDGVKLECVSPQDLEDELKACKESHQVLPVTLCSLTPDLKQFLCSEPDGKQFDLALSDADNYFCVSEKDRKRIEERCKQATHQ